jgi:hypothetical protein
VEYPANYEDLLRDIAQQTNSELILFFIVFLAAMVVVFLPFYLMMGKQRKETREAEKEKRDSYTEREKEIINVIKENSEVNAGLKVTMEKYFNLLELINATTNQSFGRIHQRIDEILTACTNTGTESGEIKRLVINTYEAMKLGSRLIERLHYQAGNDPIALSKEFEKRKTAVDEVLPVTAQTTYADL